MENRRRFSKNQMQISKSKAKSNSIICKKHPKHKQNPGVCSVCLSEKLSLLSKISRSNTTTITTTSSSSLSSLSSSSDVSSCSSPLRYRMDNNVLIKSRSLALIMRRREGGILEESNGNKKKGGFLSKLLNSRRNRKDEGLTHSRTMRGRVITRLRTTAA
uniref:Uncharacterized protein LOC104224886 n=1 Tax=Nicotiana sylvestris TaxID=4096 RepID=A0A1U7W4E0_NICSY|nr:PREDICTED: uncharacterized protein LOC104224886 [Nicotiana sylvestris]